jgi:phosphorylcholine metabolism protein LicD
MSGKGHNKKRNTGLLYEFLVRCISQAVVDDNKKRSNAALKVIRRHFKPGSELYKEFRLINSLIKTTVSSEAVAASIVQEAKVAARAYDTASLDREKSLLISSINRSIKDEDFYDHQVNDYKMYATIQTLINDWRDSNRDLGRQAQYEDQLVKWLMTEKSSTADTSISEESPGTSRLLMKVMMKRLNEKYAKVLSSDQKHLLRAYAFATANDDPMSIKLKLEEIKQKLISEIDTFGRTNEDNEYINKKLAEARKRLDEETLETVDDDTVTRFMLYTKLSSELSTEEK